MSYADTWFLLPCMVSDVDIRCNNTKTMLFMGTTLQKDRSVSIHYKKYSRTCYWGV